MPSLTAKLEKLRAREKDSELADVRVRKELEVNENEIVSGLYEIILSQAEGENPVEKFTGKLKRQIAGAPAKESASVAKVEPSAQAEPAPEESDPVAEPRAKAADASVADAPIDIDIFEIDKDKTSSFSLDALRKAGGQETAGESMEPEAALFPKSVVKTVKGRVIGEYYYDPKVPRDKRHYIYNARFFLDRLSGALERPHRPCRSRSAGRAAADNPRCLQESLREPDDAFSRVHERDSQ